MFQSKQALIAKTLERGGLAGLTNLALRYYERNNQPNHPHFVPTALQIEVTTACNLKCTMCEHTYMQQVGGHFGFNEFKKLLDDNPTIQVINLTGIGEALMNPEFLQMVEYAKQKGIYVWFTDNFTLMIEKNIQRIIDAGVDFVVLSLDGTTKEVFEKIRVGANFEKVIGNLKNFIRMRNERKLKTPLIGINMVVMNENYHQIADMVKFANELGIVDKLMFITIVLSDSTGNLSIWSVPRDKLQAEVEKAKKAAEGTSIQVISWPNVSPERKKETGCDYPWSNPYITYNGDVVPCCFIPQQTGARAIEENIMGNILKEDLKKIWVNKKYEEFRRKVKSSNPPTSCKSCPKFYGQI